MLASPAIARVPLSQFTPLRYLRFSTATIASVNNSADSPSPLQLSYSIVALSSTVATQWPSLRLHPGPSRSLQDLSPLSTLLSAFLPLHSPPTTAPQPHSIASTLRTRVPASGAPALYRPRLHHFTPRATSACAPLKWPHIVPTPAQSRRRNEPICTWPSLSHAANLQQLVVPSPARRPSAPTVLSHHCVPCALRSRSLIFSGFGAQSQPQPHGTCIGTAYSGWTAILWASSAGTSPSCEATSSLGSGHSSPSASAGGQIFYPRSPLYRKTQNPKAARRPPRKRVRLKWGCCDCFIWARVCRSYPARSPAACNCRVRQLPRMLTYDRAANNAASVVQYPRLLRRRGSWGRGRCSWRCPGARSGLGKEAALLVLVAFSRPKDVAVATPRPLFLHMSVNSRARPAQSPTHHLVSIKRMHCMLMDPGGGAMHRCKSRIWWTIVANRLGAQTPWMQAKTAGRRRISAIEGDRMHGPPAPAYKAAAPIPGYAPSQIADTSIHMEKRPRRHAPCAGEWERTRASAMAHGGMHRKCRQLQRHLGDAANAASSQERAAICTRQQSGLPRHNKVRTGTCVSPRSI